MTTLQYIIIFSLIGGVFSLLGGLVLLRNRSSAQSLAKYATPFAGGALLAAVFIDLLPEGIEFDKPSSVLLAALVGMVLFFLAEGGLRWFHHHHEHDKKGRQSSASLIVVGDTLHNALDGVAIAASFLISIPTGIVTTLAVAAHEIPQEIGDFGLLLRKGYSRKKVLLVNILSALSTLVAAVITYMVGSSEALPLGVLLGISAGFLLYIAASDVIPTIHESGNNRKQFSIQASLLILGVLIVGLVTTVTHSYIDDGHSHSESEHSEQEDHNDQDPHTEL